MHAAASQGTLRRLERFLRGLEADLAEHAPVLVDPAASVLARSLCVPSSPSGEPREFWQELYTLFEQVLAAHFSHPWHA